MGFAKKHPHIFIVYAGGIYPSRPDFLLIVPEEVGGPERIPGIAIRELHATK